jgi:hypothetical protein
MVLFILSILQRKRAPATCRPSRLSSGSHFIRTSSPAAPSTGRPRGSARRTLPERDRRSGSDTRLALPAKWTLRFADNRHRISDTERQIFSCQDMPRVIFRSMNRVISLAGSTRLDGSALVSDDDGASMKSSHKSRSPWHDAAERKCARFVVTWAMIPEGE